MDSWKIAATALFAAPFLGVSAAFMLHAIAEAAASTRRQRHEARRARVRQATREPEPGREPLRRFVNRS